MNEKQVDLEAAIDEKREAVTALRYWRNGGDSFDCKLYSLIQKADPGNRMRLRKSFPVIVETWNEWYCCATEEEFFAKYGMTMREQA